MLNNMKSTADINRERNLKILEQRRTFKMVSLEPKKYIPITYCYEKMIEDY